MFYIIYYVIFCGVLISVKSNKLFINLPVSRTQLEDLVPNLCDDLEWHLGIQYPEEMSCKETLVSDLPDRRTTLSPAEVVLKCDRLGTVTVQADSNNSQIILLIPNDGSEIIYTSLKKSERYGTLQTRDSTSYTFWSAALDDDGRPSLWVRGSDLPQQEVSKTEAVRIHHPKFKFEEGIETVLAVITIDIDKDTEPCFMVTNSCRKKTLDDYYYKDIVWTKNQPSLTIDPLLLDDECTFTVRGRNETSLIYHTPACQLRENKCTVPEIPLHIRTYSMESDLQGWDILVNWSIPHHPPTRYNVTLCASSCYTNILHGNLTNAKFIGVRGDSIYSVFVEAQLGNHSAHTSRRAFFPVTRQREQLSVKALVGGAWFTALVVAALLTACAILWRKHLQHSVYYKELEDKLSKEYTCESSTEDVWEIRPERLQLHEVIGEGAFGVVRRGSLSPGGRDVAVKMMKDFPGVEEIRSFMSEMELMKSVGAHAHVVSLVGCCRGRRPLIVAEYCPRGDLLTYLRCNYDVMVSKRNAKYFSEKDLIKYNQQSIDKHSSNLVVNKLYDLQDVCDQELTFPDLLSFCRQIAMGMEFLASNRVVHRDLAARNILVTGDKTLKIADFGLSRDVYQDNQYKQKGNGKMPIKWMALESLTQRIYTTQSDVWSFGVVMWEVVTLGGSPYTEVSAARLTRLLRAGYRMPRPANCTKHLYELMLSCWHARPRERPTFTELHQRLDQLLNDACADNYLSLDLQGSMPSSPPSVYRYLKLIITGKRGWSRESYERPLKASQSNHYTSQPAVLARPSQLCV